MPPVDRHLLSALTQNGACPSGRPRPNRKDDHFTALAKGRSASPRSSRSEPRCCDWIAHESRKTWRPYGALVDYNPSLDYPVAYCHSVDDGKWDEWNFVFQPLVRDGLISEMGNGKVRLTDKGWELLQARPKVNVRVQLGFVAMMFRGMDDVRAAIELGIRRAGLRAEADPMLTSTSAA